MIEPTTPSVATPLAKNWVAMPHPDETPKEIEYSFDTLKTDRTSFVTSYGGKIFGRCRLHSGDGAPYHPDSRLRVLCHE
jgi:hypothetical protein